MRITVEDRGPAGPEFAATRQEPFDQPRRDVHLPEQDRHRRGVVLAIAALDPRETLDDRHVRAFGQQVLDVRVVLEARRVLEDVAGHLREVVRRGLRTRPGPDLGQQGARRLAEGVVRDRVRPVQPQDLVRVVGARPAQSRLGRAAIDLRRRDEGGHGVGGIRGGAFQALEVAALPDEHHAGLLIDRQRHRRREHRSTRGHQRDRDLELAAALRDHLIGRAREHVLVSGAQLPGRRHPAPTRSG